MNLTCVHLCWSVSLQCPNCISPLDAAPEIVVYYASLKGSSYNRTANNRPVFAGGLCAWNPTGTRLFAPRRAEGLFFIPFTPTNSEELLCHHELGVDDFAVSGWIGADHQGRRLVRGCGGVDGCRRPGMPKFLIGATIVSVATTLPEIIVSTMAAAEGSTDHGNRQRHRLRHSKHWPHHGNFTAIFIPAVIQREASSAFKGALMVGSVARCSGRFVLRRSV